MEKLNLSLAVGLAAMLAVGVLKVLYDMASYRRSDQIDWNDPSTYDRLNR